jgi:hypothetical protein
MLSQDLISDIAALRSDGSDYSSWHDLDTELAALSSWNNGVLGRWGMKVVNLVRSCPSHEYVHLLLEGSRSGGGDEGMSFWVSSVARFDWREFWELREGRVGRDKVSLTWPSSEFDGRL